MEMAQLELFQIEANCSGLQSKWAGTSISAVLVPHYLQL